MSRVKGWGVPVWPSAWRLYVLLKLVVVPAVIVVVGVVVTVPVVPIVGHSGRPEMATSIAIAVSNANRRAFQILIDLPPLGDRLCNVPTTLGEDH